MTPRCSLCTARRASRRCPALSQDICPRCCGTRRGRDIACTADCPHLAAAREQVEQRSVTFADLRRVREIDPEFAGDFEHGILGIRETRFRDLKDREVKEAVENLMKTVRTGESGLLYEYRSPNPRIQIIADALKAVIDRYREGKNVSHSVGTDEVKVILLAVLNAVKTTSRRDPDSVDYLDHIARFGAPVAPAAPQPAGRIILP